MFLCMTPNPPSLAKAIASPDSVTESIGELSSGMLSGMRRVSFVVTSTSEGTTVL